jgi:hypothetical protein
MQIVARQANSDDVGGRRKVKLQTLGVDVDVMTPSRVESIEPSSQGIVRGKLEPSFVILPVFESATGTFRHARQISELIAIRTSKSRIVKRSFMPEPFQTIRQNSKRARPVPLPTDRIPGRFLTISTTQAAAANCHGRIAHVS